jgi:hypothetical protein
MLLLILNAYGSPTPTAGGTECVQTALMTFEENPYCLIAELGDELVELFLVKFCFREV